MKTSTSGILVKTISVRLHQNEDDTSRKLNRTEILRPIPEGSDDFTRLHVLRADAESINRGIEEVSRVC